jgi:hypothetical protein
MPNKVLRGQIPNGTKLCGVSYPGGTTFRYKYFHGFKTELKSILVCEFRDYMGSIREKNQRPKISCYCPFKLLLPIPSDLLADGIAYDQEQVTEGTE